MSSQTDLIEITKIQQPFIIPQDARDINTLNSLLQNRGRNETFRNNINWNRE